MNGKAEKRAEGLRNTMESMVSSLDKDYLRPLQKSSYQCMASCCDTARRPDDLQQCCQNCEVKVHTAERVVQTLMNDFQNRLQRCVQRCQDKAQEILPAQPGQKDIEKAQNKLADCAADCAEEYEKQIPKLKATVAEQLKKLK